MTEIQTRDNLHVKMLMTEVDEEPQEEIPEDTQEMMMMVMTLMIHKEEETMEVMAQTEEVNQLIPREHPLTQMDLY